MWQLEGRVLITGGTGSLGQAIVRRAHREHWPVEITIYSRDEVKQALMRVRYPKVRYILGDVQDPNGLAIACSEQDVVIHAAAYKQVPSAEVNAMAAIQTNVFGSMNVARAAWAEGVERVIGISTDKACAPINLYGKTKACMESLFQQANSWGGTQFNLCRYGNVIGSRGSIIPLFKRQAKEGGPLTITDVRMTRFWLTLQEAVDLILRCVRESEPGTIIVPKLPAMSVVDLGSVIGKGCPTKDIGIRPGEKIHEHLLHRGESLHAQERPEFYRVFPPSSGYRGCLPDEFEYRTDCPVRWLTPDEMRDMIVRSEEEVG